MDYAKEIAGKSAGVLQSICVMITIIFIPMRRVHQGKQLVPVLGFVSGISQSMRIHRHSERRAWLPFDIRELLFRDHHRLREVRDPR